MRKFILFFLSTLAFLNPANSQKYETYTENFDDNVKGWFTINESENKNNQSYTKIDDGYYFLKLPGRQSSFLVNKFKVHPNFDYSIELTFKCQNTSDSELDFFGIFWGHESREDFLFFGVNRTKKFTFLNSKNGKLNVKASSLRVKRRHFKRLKKSNVLKIIKKEGEIAFLINDAVIYQTEPTNFHGNNIGFGTVSLPGEKKQSILSKRDKTGYLASSFDTYGTNINYWEVIVDSLRIKRYLPSINLVDNPVNGYKLESLSINTIYHELAPVISPDGKMLFFVESGHPKNIGGEKDQDIWLSELDENGKWKKAQNIGYPLNNFLPNSVFSIMPDGNRLIVNGVYDNAGKTIERGVSISVRKDGKWQLPVKQEIINYENENDYVNHFLSPDGTKLIMSIENSNSIGDRDLFVSFLQENSTWSEPMNLGKTINTYAEESSPFLAADGKTLYFSSYGHPGFGNEDIFVTRRLDDTWINWSDPKNLGPEINTTGSESFFSLSAEGDYAYMVSDNPMLSAGGCDIFRIKLSQAARPDPVVLVKGKVYNQKNRQPIDADISYEDLTQDVQLGKAFSTKEDGYQIVLPKGAVYGFRAEAKGFIPVSENIDLKELDEYAEKQVELFLVPLEKGQTIRLNNIFFDFDKAELKPESYPELNRLVHILNLNPEMEIQISGHTDNFGTKQYNLKLSKNRADAVVQYILENGITPSRISSVSFGKSKPIATNETEEGRQLNRRVEFTIL